MKNQIPIYIISISQTPERRLHIQRQLDAFGLEYSFVDVDDIDKYKLESKTYRNQIAELLGIDESVLEDKYTSVLDYIKNCHHQTYEEAKKNGIGSLTTTLSHVKIYNLMIKNDIDAACILEDDATLLPTFPEVLQTATKLDWDILLLANQPPYFPRNLIQNEIIKRILIRDLIKHPKRIKHTYTVDKDLLFISSKKRDYRIKCLLEEYGFNSRLYPKQLETIKKAIQEHDTRFSAIIKKFVSNYFGPSWIKREYYIIYRILCRILETYTPIQLGAFPKKSGIDYAMYKILCYNLAMYTFTQLGTFPKKSNLNLITDHHCIAEPKCTPYSAMAYLVKQSTAMKWKRKTLAKNSLAIDETPWELYKNERVKLRLITPPCVTATYNYLVYSARCGYTL